MEETEVKKTQLPDAEDADVKEKEDPEKREEKLVQLWATRFKKSEDFRRAVIRKNLRMYYLYRAYRKATNYAYGTSLMPPTGFEIVETVKPRLASAEIKVSIYPTKQEDVGNKSIDAWDDLIEYDLQVMEFDDKKIQWINAMLIFGNGFAQLMWAGGEDGDPDMEIVDNFLFYPDPQSMNRLKNSRWEIKQGFKNKAVIEKEEKKRGDNPLYLVREINQDTGEEEEVPLIKSRKWKEIEDEQPNRGEGEDPRKERYEINTLKMGQIDDGSAKGQADDAGPGESTPDKDTGERNIEIWECWDHVEEKLQVIFNRKHLVRDEENPYMRVRKGKLFIDLPDISLNWELYAMGHLEPVETTIHEIADSRNQAMDSIVFSLDPIRKVKKGQGYKTEDLKHEPGATWYLQKADDVVFERPPEISRMWVEKDNILRREIETSLAMSEYVRGIPAAEGEPASKVELLLMQTNIRFSLLVRQMEIAFTEMVNALIQMNQAFLGEDKSMRIVGKKLRWAKFTQEDKEVIVDAYVDIKPKKEKSPEQESREVLEMYKLFVVEDKPEGDPASPEVIQWKKKKATLQKLIVERFDLEEYADILAPEIQAEQKQEIPPQGKNPAVPSGPAVGIADNPVPELLKQPTPGPEEILPPEETIIPQATTPETQPGPGVIQRILARAKQGKLIG